MPVNSAFKGLFNNRFVTGSGTAVVMLAIFCSTTSFTKSSDRDVLAKKANLIIREIGHRLLLQGGDSTSRVMPVTEVKEGTFLLTFENEFVFSHDSLVMLAQGSFPKTQFPSGYTVTVHDCITASIIYGFQVSSTSRNILACEGRRQPSGCYTIEIALPDLYANVEPKKADIEQLTEKTESLKSGPQKINSAAEGLKSAKIDSQKPDPKPEGVKTHNADLNEGNLNLEDVKATTSGYPIINLVYSGLLVLTGVALLIGRYGKALSPVPVQSQGMAITKEHIVPELPVLGKFLFDVKDQRLLLGSEVISLTDKECSVLELLYKNFGELIPRETLMQKIWINEGVITGRSLDMFVSKLRKKLSRDPELRITNVHGKGYKLEIPGTQIL